MEHMLKFIQEDWPLLLPVVLGFLAVYWLLPRGHREWVVPGAAAGAAALVCGGWFLIHREFATPEAVLFYAFSGIAVLSGGLMLAQHNPVRSALAFALVVLSSCGLFLLLAAPFLMAATMIIYGGAIIITFLFVIMLAQQIGMTSADQLSREPFLASLAGFVLLASLLVVLQWNYDTEDFDKKFRSVHDKLQRIIAAKTSEEITAIVKEKGRLENEEGEKLDLVDELLRLMPHLEHRTPSHEDINVYLLEKTDLKTAEAQKLCEKIDNERRRMRHALGSLQPPAKLPLSSFSSAPANGPLPFDGEQKLPARNVEALGKALFTDYLVAVEMAGVLLLVATIGAIVIAGRRGDKDTGEVLR